MDIPQLKLLAGHVRGQLKQSSCLVGHSQALDLVAALPGLRNWPEVMAFPERVAACELDTISASRLAYRLKKKFAFDVSAKELLSLLARDGVSVSRSVLEVWPGGPLPGVYVTTSDQAINALLERYEEATDGGLVYAEQAANGWEGSIDLGEYGLWSSGIDRLPSGTLLVVGPLQLDQSSWKNSAERLEMACLHALNSEHRVAVLVDTPTPDNLCEDLDLMVRTVRADSGDTHTALQGIVTEDGELLDRRPFARGYPTPAPINTKLDTGAIPKVALEPLRRELAARTQGMVLFGASRIGEHTAYEQLAAALALTEHAGPAARIMPRHRGTPAKDWMVPEPIKQLPFLPSIDSAYAQGYRRMLVDAHYTEGEVWLGYDDVLFMGATYGHQVRDIALNLVARSGGREAFALQRIVAVLGLLHVEGKKGDAAAADLFLRGKAEGPTGDDWDEFEDFLKSHRVVRWEDELSALLDAGVVTAAGAKRSDPRNTHLTDFLARRRGGKKAS